MVILINNIYKETATITIGPLLLENGEVLSSVEMQYERIGPENSPVILVCHALTGNHQAVGSKKEPGWWSGLIGEHHAINTITYQVITFNVLGGCHGSTGPQSINPETNRLYRMDFPTITIRDMVQAQFLALQKLNIQKLYAVIGGSLGGMQALEWGLLYPENIERLILLAVTPTLSDYGIAFNHIAEQAIKQDPSWRNGHYQSSQHVQGLAIARMIGMVTYRSSELFSERFGRRVSDKGFAVHSYLDYQGEKLLKRFEPNSYLYLLQAMNSHDIGRGRGGWQEACKSYACPILMISYEHDLIYESKTITEFAKNTPNCTYHHVQTKFGHDGFLTEFEKWDWMVKDFLNS
ncbi:homoserine O-acetyltransferase MetX [Paucisalibacillus globulus]|uniref:homoserine O-acetyltransferase MetX n=1 Tax=Paucisalibacillus globulus TaxID=351095 RepID=UPI00316AC083